MHEKEVSDVGEMGITSIFVSLISRNIISS